MNNGDDGRRNLDRDRRTLLPAPEIIELGSRRPRRSRAEEEEREARRRFRRFRGSAVAMIDSRGTVRSSSV